MRLTWQGSYEREEQLPKAELPTNAVCLREPDNLEEVNRQAVRFLPAAMVPVQLADALRCFCWGFPGWSGFFHWGGLVVSIFLLVPHELLHAAAYPRGAECGLWISLHGGALFVTGTSPMSRQRFLWVSLLPACLLSLLPLTAWVIFPAMNGIWFTASALHLVSCTGDFCNCWNMIRQVPKDATIQQSGFHTYWYFSPGSAEKEE